MPVTLVSVLKGRTSAEKRALMEAVQRAIGPTTLALPVHDRNLRLAEHGTDEWLLPEGRSERYVLVEIALFEGRRRRPRERCTRPLSPRWGALGVDKGDVFIPDHRTTKENFGIRGGQRADLVQLGYQVVV
jgi:hypothetical protein